MKNVILMLGFMLATTMGFAQNLQSYEKKGKWGWKDENGKKVVIEAQYQESASFYDGMAQVKLNDKVGMIDKTGKILIPIEYDYLSNPEGKLVRMRKEKGGKMGFVSTEGKEILAPKYDKIDGSSYSEVFFVKLNGKWGLMGLDLKELNEIKYEVIRGPISVNPYAYLGIRDGREFRLSAKGVEEGTTENGASNNSSNNTTKKEFNWSCSQCGTTKVAATKPGGGCRYKDSGGKMANGTHKFTK